MRGISIAAAAAALFASSTMAANKAVVNNMCDDEVFLWAVDASDSVDGAVARNPMLPHKIAPGSAYREVMRRLYTGGVSLKVSQTDDLYGAITQFEYTLDGPTWYDLSNVNCEGEACPFQATGMYLESAPGCPTVTCTPGNETCHQAYTNPNDNWASLCCEDGEPDVILYLCTDSPSSAPAPAPEPSTYGAQVEAAQVTTPKPTHHRPKPTPVDPATEVVEVTEVSTVVVTVTPGADSHHRRHVHQHAHAHAH